MDCRSMIMLIAWTLLCVPTLNQFIDNDEKICRKIDVSSNINKYSNDMVKNGVTSQEWSDESSVPVIIGPDKQTDFIYFIVNTQNGDNQTYDRSNFNLHQDDTQYAKSQFQIDRSSRVNREVLAVKIIYHCVSFGGALINYKLEMKINGCGKAYVSWSKLCGNPLMNRQGLVLEMQLNNFKKQIVKNGLLVNPSYFDSDLDTNVTRIPHSQNSTFFHLFIDPSITNDNFPFGQQDDSIFNQLSGFNVQDLNTKVSRIRVDADETIIDLDIKGQLVNGGYVDQTHKEFVINYKCLGRRAEAMIELNIQLKNFKDITLFFVKQCGSQYSFDLMFNLDDNSSHPLNIFANLLFAFFFIFLAIIAYRIWQQKELNSQVIPFYPVLYRVSSSVYDKLKIQYDTQLSRFRNQYNNDTKDYELTGLEQQKDVGYGSI